MSVPNVPNPDVVRGGRNLIRNPSVETNTTNFALPGGAVMTRVATHPWIGGWCLQVDVPVTSAAGVQQSADLTGIALTGVAHIVSAKLRVWAAVGVTIPSVEIRVSYTDGNIITAVSNTPGIADWQEITIPPQATDPARTISAITLYVRNPAVVAAPYTVFVDGLDLRIDEPDCDDYIDGVQGTRYAWTGTAHASASTRAALPANYVAAPPSRGGRNRIVNPSSEAFVALTAGTGVTTARSADIAYVGSWATKVILAASGTANAYMSANLTGIALTGVQHLIAAAMRVYVPLNTVTPPRVVLRVDYASGGGTVRTSVDLIPTGDWQTIRPDPIFTDPAKTIGIVYFLVEPSGTQTAPILFYVDALDVRVDEPDADDYIDGSLGARYAWTGAANNSLSTRLTLPQPEPSDPMAISASRNYIANPSVEVSTANVGVQGSVALAQTAEAAVFGAMSLKALTHPTTTYSGPYFAAVVTGVTPGQHTVRLRLRLYLAAGAVLSSVGLYITYKAASGGGSTSVTTAVTGTGDWLRVDVEAVTTAGKDIGGINVILNTGLSPHGLIFYVDGVDLRIDDPMDGYIDGSMGTRYAWTGTVGLSPSTRAKLTIVAPVRPRTGPITIRGELWRATKDGVLVEDISDLVVSGKVDWQADRSSDSGGTAMAAEFVVRDPARVIPYVDCFAPFVNLTYGNGETVRRQYGLFVSDLPVTDYWFNRAQATLRGKDLTWVMRNSILTRSYNVPAAVSFDSRMRALITASGLSLMNVRESSRQTGYARSFVPGVSRLEAFNKLAAAMAWYTAYMDLDGSITSIPYRDFASTQPIATYGPAQVTGIVRATPVTTGIGNVCVVVKDNPSKDPILITAVNDDPDSPVAISKIGEVLIDGRPIRNGDLENAADAQQYARYRIQTAASYTVNLDISVIPDLLQGMYQTIDLDLYSGDDDLCGRYWLTGWSIGFTAADGPTRLTLARVVTFAESVPT